MGFLREFEILDDDVVLNLYSDRFATEPKGLAGGANGTCGALTITREGKTIDVPPTGGAQLQTGDIVSLRMGGGAGWGQPEQRQIDAIEQDIAEGLISAQQASADYGYNLSERDAKQLEAGRSAAAHPQGFTAEVQSVRVKMREREST
jgi:N-methylhydantoinase B